MNGGPDNLPAPRDGGTQIELLMALELFGLRVDATATFGSGADTILSVRLGDLSLGDLIQFLVQKAEPGLDFRLAPPWDFLNSINLHNFTFEVDLTRFRIGFRYDDIGFSTPFISLTGIQVFYSPATADRSKSVDLSLFGSFLGIDFTTSPGLTWDVLSEPAPSVPGQGQKVFDLEYLALGQHVTVRNAANLTTIGAVIDALEGAHRTVNPHKNPLSELTALRFDATAGWLFATKFSALETVTLSAVFNDPVLYGLRVALDGKRVGKLAGLEFEILYRKISDSVGVFHTELKLPDAVRTIEAGEATITLPIIDIDVYTNGNFLVDLGFPRNLDFSRALSVDFIVFVPIPIPVSAAVGLYFGVLSGETSNQVPQVTNGRFDPVIVAGIGVRVGLGYAISLGPLQADFFAGVVGIVEGVLAWFHPDADPTSTTVFYRVSGTVGIQIHIAGTVNFAILQASLDIEAYADAAAVVESYQPIHLTFEAGVSISLSVKVLFFHITLSFSATIRESITIGSASPTPWVLGAAQPASGQRLSARGLLRAGGGVLRANAVFAEVLRTGITWRDRTELVSPVTPGALTVEVYLQPMVTAGLIGDSPGEALSAAAQPQLVAALFVADHGQMEGALAVANRAAFTALPDGPGTAATDADLYAFGVRNAQTAGLLPPGTVLAAPAGTVTIDGAALVAAGTDTLAALGARLLSPFEQLAREALVWALESADLSVRAATDPTPDAAVPLGADSPVSASHLHALYADLVDPARPFPLARVLDFLTARNITFDLQPIPNAAPNPSFTVFPMPPFLAMAIDGETVDFTSGPYTAGPDYQSFIATYFHDLAAAAAPPPAATRRNAASSAPGQESVAAVLFTDYFAFLMRQLVQDALDLYRAYPYTATSPSTGSAGDTLDDIANRFGISDPDLVQLNLDEHGLLAADRAVTFATGDTTTTQAGDTLRDLVDRSGHSAADVAAAIGAQPGILLPGAALLLPGGGTHTVAAGETLLSIASGPADMVSDDAAVTRIGRANQTSSAFFAPGADLTIVALSAGVVGGETVRSLAGRLHSTPLLVARAVRDRIGVLRVGSAVAVAGGRCTVAADDTLASIAARLATTIDVVVAAAADVPRLLRPLTTLDLPTGDYVVGPGDTLSGIAARLGLAAAQVGQAAADVPDLLLAGVAFALPTLTYTVAASSPGSTDAESLASIADRFGVTLADLLTGDNPDALVLRPGTQVSFGLPTQVRTGETLRELAGRFGITQPAGLAELVRALDDTPGLLVPGAELVVAPPGTYVVENGDTLASIAQRYQLSVVELVLGSANDANLDNAGLLMPQTTIRLPPIPYVPNPTDTPLRIAQHFGLTVDQLVLSNRDVGFGTVVVPDAEQLPLEVLVADLARAGAFNKPAGALARFLLHGLRLPAPDEISATTPTERAALRLYPLYTLTGQQVTPPSPVPQDYAITLSPVGGSPRPVITFPGGGTSVTVPLSADDRDMIGKIGSQLTEQPPIDDTPLAATPYPTTVVAPRQYALGKPIPWQAADPPQFLHDPGAATPAPAAATVGSPALYPFPDALRDQVATSAELRVDGPGLLVDLVTGVQATPSSPADQQPLAGFGWATRIDFGVRQAPDPAQPGQFLPTVFEVFGTDPAATDDLARVLAYLDGPGINNVVTLAVLYSASALAGSDAGLRSDPHDPADVLLLKANLSTRSRPTVAAVADAPDTLLTAATTADARSFLTLLWEATVTNTGGYHLFYRTGNGDGLPPEIFNQDPTATVSVLATVFAPPDAASTVVLQPFHNTAVVLEPVADPTAAVLATPRRYTTSGSATSLQAIAAELGSAAGAPDGLSVQELGAANVETRNLLAPTATVTVGGTDHHVTPGDTIGSVARTLATSMAAVVDAIGADAGVLNPGATLEVYPGWLTHRGALRAGAAGFRVVRVDPDPGAGDPTAPAAGQNDPRTKLEVLFNLIGYRLTGDPASGFTASPDGLPVGPARPTSGPLNHGLTTVAGQDTWTYQKQIRIDRYARSGSASLGDLQDPYAGVGTTAQFGWQFQDVFGNRLLPSQTIDVDVHYTDDLIGISQWPALLTGYRFTGPPDPVALVVTLALDTSVFVPTPGDVFAPVGSGGGPAGIAARAAAHRDRYAEIFWQVSHDLVAEVTTTVDGATPHPVAAGQLAGFSAAAWGYLQTVAQLTQAAVPVPQGATLADVAAAYHVTVAELAQANRSIAQNADAANLLNPAPATPRAVVVEARYSVIQNDTLTHIAAQAPTFVDTDEGQIAADNPMLVLQPGRLIVLGTVHRVTTTDTLTSLAAANGLDPAQIGAANAQRRGLLIPGTSLTLPTPTTTPTTYQVRDGDTLASIATRSGIAVADVTTALAAAGGGPLVPGSDAIVPVALSVVAGDTLAGLAGRFAVTTGELAQANATLDVLMAGAEIVLPTGRRYRVQPQDTLASIAAANDTGVTDLAGSNADTSALLRVGARLTSSYRVQARDTFTAVAARFGVPPAALGAANALVAGVVAAEQSVLLGTRLQPVEAGDTFASLAAATGVTVAALAEANAATPGLLTAGVPVALPRHVRVAGPNGHTHTIGAGETLAGVAMARGVDVSLLGAANADVDGILAPGATLSFTVPGGRTYQSVIRANDTLSTMALALQATLNADGVAHQLTAGLLADANQPVACLAAGGLMLVPPATTEFSLPVTETNAAALFPLETTLTVRRTAHVDPALSDNPAVTSVSSPLPPFLAEGAAGRSVALRAFADTFEAAFTTPPLKLTTTGATAGVGTPRFVAVHYGPGSAVDISVDGSAPYFFAPRPLTARPDPTGVYRTSLWSSPNPLPVLGYERGQGLAQQPQPMSFRGIDLDTWGRQVLTLLDRVLSADYAVAAYRLDPAAYRQLVAAKSIIAGAIRDSITQVTGPGTAPPSDLALAHDVLYRRLLTTLSDAYQVDAVVAVPVTVTAPPDWAGDTAPRLHGQPVGVGYAVPADSHTVATGDTLASVAAGRSTVWAVGADNAQAVGLLSPGVDLTLQAALVYRTAPGDTLAGIADAHDLPLATVVAAVADVTGLLVPGVPVTVPTMTLRTLAAVFAVPLPLLIDALADATGILLPGAVVSGPWTDPIADGDTLAAVAARFGRTLPELGTALGAVPGLLAAGVEILLSNGSSYTTRSADTLAGIATTVGVPVGSLAVDAGQVPGLLVPGVPISLPPYLVAALDTLTTVAAHFPVPVAALGAALADTPGVLEHGAPVNLVVRTYTAQPEDSVFSVLAALALDVATPAALNAAIADFAAMNAGLPGLITAGTVLAVPAPVEVVDGDTIAALAGAHQLSALEVATSIAGRTDVLRPDVTIALPDPADPAVPPQVVTTGQGDSLDRIAAVTGVALDAVSAAVQDRPDLLVPGAIIGLADPEIPPYTVGPDDTLVVVAARIGHGLTPSWIVTAVLHAAGILTAGATVRYLTRVPGYSLSDAAITLTDSVAHPAQSTALTFLVHTASNTAFSTLSLNVEYQVNQLEYDIENVAWAQGYQSSHWLTFLKPPTDNQVGRIDIPIALRSFPLPPSVTNQRIVAATARTAVRTPDTLHTVAATVGVPAVAAAGTLLAPGAVLELPTADRHRARPGETAANLAARVGAPPALVAAAARRHGVLRGVAEDGAMEAELPARTVVPVPREHTVASGESLATIAEQHGVPVAHLFALNAHTPGLLQSGATVDATTFPTLQDLRRYDYDYTFAVKRAAQDTISTGYTQNTAPGSDGAAVAESANGTAGLGGSLAQFATIRGPLEQDLALIAAIDPMIPTSAAAAANPVAAQALAVLGNLATQIAADWVTWIAPPPVAAAAANSDGSQPGSTPQHHPRFELRCGGGATGQTTVQLLPKGPVADLMADEPHVSLAGHLAADGHAMAGVAPISFTRAAAVPATASGTSPDVDQFTLAMPGRDLISTQNIWGRVSLARNTNLLAGVPTDSAFVYTVPDARMPAPATPLVTAADEFDLTTVPFEPAGAPPNTDPDATGRRPLSEWLINFFDSLTNRYAVLRDDTLPKIAGRHGLQLADLTPAVADIAGLLRAGTRLALPGGTYTTSSADTLRQIAAALSVPLAALVDAAAGPGVALTPETLLRPVANSRYLRLSVDYGFSVAVLATQDPTQQNEIVSRLPVLLRPTFLFDSTTDLGPDSGFCADIARHLTSWAAGRGVPDDVGMWILDVSLYTTLPSTSAPTATTPADAGTALPDIAPPLLQLSNIRLRRDRIATPAAAPHTTPTMETTP